MERQIIIMETEKYVQKQLEGEGTGHDWWHIHRVTELTKKIAEKENADYFICLMAALTHDLIDEKVTNKTKRAMNQLMKWFDQMEIPSKEQKRIIEIITTISFKGGNKPTPSTLEAKVVQDADRLDAIGAIGIARCFTYAGSAGNIIHDPEVKPREEITEEDYRKKDGTAIQHFYEKLLKLKDLMNTETGLKIAEERHRFMEIYLDQFYMEWNGEK
ncbi:phosphohydrolase [Halalkalibacillus sediminis]|uniref:Phosphohydrolase n=1 Tax=Halalkalibacillus sediminis TaxID=2018042 RepID=A0A2I0QSP4_9BACI|nr:HD domain-containing protein [Halalkalibacillus sediminis]PKR77130.1 phosphohydrolase [Halalkalibacillus sediminis]